MRYAKVFRAFTLVEVMVSLTITSIAAVAATGVVKMAVSQSGDQRSRFICLSLAQQQMERMSAVETTSALLDDKVYGKIEERISTSGVDGPTAVRRLRNRLGEIDLNGKYEVYWKIEPEVGGTKRVMVYCQYPSWEVDNYVRFETIR